MTTPDSGPASGGVGGAPSCVAAAAIQGASARPRGRGVRFAVRGRTTVEVFRQTLGGRITNRRLVASFPRRTRDFTWNGRATLRGRRTPAGAVYTARFRAAGGAVKHVTLLRRANGRFARRGTFRTLAGCGTIRDATLARPVFGGRAGKPLDIRFRLNTPARVEVVVRRGKRTVRRFRARLRQAGRTFKLRLPASATRHGAHRVTITARPVGAPAQTLRLTAIRR